MTAVIVTAVLGVLIMAGLLRFFYGWIFHPMRELQEGVRRVARGDFDSQSKSTPATNWKNWPTPSTT